LDYITKLLPANKTDPESKMVRDEECVWDSALLSFVRSALAIPGRSFPFRMLTGKNLWEPSEYKAGRRGYHPDK
jgi:hypothetical protein